MVEATPSPLHGHLGDDSVLARADLFSPADVLGPKHRVREAGIAFGRAFLYRLGKESLGPIDRTRPDIDTKAFAAISFPFDLEDLPDHRCYREVTFEVSFDDPGVVALSLAGLGGVAASDDSRARPAGAGSGQLPVRSTRPYQLQLFGIGSSAPRWKLTAPAEPCGVLPGTQVVDAVIEAPLETRALTGTLGAEACVVHTYLGSLLPKRAVMAEPLHFSLGLEDGVYSLVDPGAG